VAAVVSGLERFCDRGPREAGLPRGARLALIAHAASIDRRGCHAAERISRMPDVRLIRLFAPEHGLYGHEQDMEAVRETTDRATGLPVVSLYGTTPTSLRPTTRQLGDLDAILFDCQDVGSRYYTYAATLSFVMEAARDSGVPVVVLDRPNPIGGVEIEGPILVDGLSSFVGLHPLPVRHGMTVGELAVLFNESFGIACDLRVVRMDGWRREMDFAATGLPWVPPSPNMPTAHTALVYPGGCLVEGTNLSEGRGTTTPFELVGAPWLDAPALVAALGDEILPGVVFRAASFRPMFQKHAGRSCAGVQIIAEDPARFRPFAAFLSLLREILRLHGGEFRWRTECYEFETERLAIDLLLGRPELRSMLEHGASIAEMEQSWTAELDRFRELRDAFLTYP
jgi:uncharacterized protein YbbC (DUF1343 family)